MITFLLQWVLIDEFLVAVLVYFYSDIYANLDVLKNLDQLNSYALMTANYSSENVVNFGLSSFTKFTFLKHIIVVFLGLGVLYLLYVR